MRHHPHLCLTVPVYTCSGSLYPIIGACFRGISRYFGDVRVLAVDDGSPLPPLPDWPIVETNPENRGFTYTANRCLTLGFETGASIVVLMNDDIVLSDGDLEWTLGIDESIPCIVSPADTASGGSDRFGAIWAITRPAWELLGPLDERLRDFQSDYAYYLLAKEKGVPVIKDYSVTVRHPESSTYKLVNKDEKLKEDTNTFERIVR